MPSMAAAICEEAAFSLSLAGTLAVPRFETPVFQLSRYRTSLCYQVQRVFKQYPPLQSWKLTAVSIRRLVFWGSPERPLPGFWTKRGPSIPKPVPSSFHQARGLPALPPVVVLWTPASAAYHTTPAARRCRWPRARRGLPGCLRL